MTKNIQERKIRHNISEPFPTAFYNSLGKFQVTARNLLDKQVHPFSILDTSRTPLLILQGVLFDR